ncbi:hypothetical protein EVAR_36924_1 [Eumeta japonica]|uniref:Uncharacterized protein n=1 Tax=Eumeta variegata TaxID=151549 RepID=A0A4C1X6D1_EUMVA|nr:hypothetical protein EVAR_36924_1 [Eumeta japonica]
MDVFVYVYLHLIEVFPSVGRQSQRYPCKSRVAPAPPAPAADEPGLALMSDHVGAGGAGRSGVAWPSGTIPARVKKLSWDDAGSDQKVRSPSSVPYSNVPYYVQHRKVYRSKSESTYRRSRLGSESKAGLRSESKDSAEGDGTTGAAEIHDATNPALADHMNLTVYF